MKTVKVMGKQTTIGAGVFFSADRMLKCGVMLNTKGDGFWSNQARSVRVRGLSVPYFDRDYGELRVYFDLNTWRTDRHGLIYTDSRFLKELKGHLNKLGFDASDIGYSEQGMQGDNYVSLDAGAKFIKSWKAALNK
jgi:hypothetical protein